MMNKKSSFLLWDAVLNCKTWMLLETTKVDSYWCNINTSTHSAFINELDTISGVNTAEVFVGANIVFKKNPKLLPCSFFILGNTQEGSSHQWLSIGTRTIDEGLFDKQFPKGK